MPKRWQSILVKLIKGEKGTRQMKKMKSITNSQNQEKMCDPLYEPTSIEKIIHKKN